jgi:tRNA/tmRNA/rRNA uracil-C5-methylase (TrmA/RlmC/RlmD family)
MMKRISKTVGAKKGKGAETAFYADFKKKQQKPKSDKSKSYQEKDLKYSEKFEKKGIDKEKNTFSSSKPSPRPKRDGGAAGAEHTMSTFARHILTALPPMEHATQQRAPEPLAAYPYMSEQLIKLKEFNRFWNDKHLEGEILPLIPAPQPREYRATTRRRVFYNGKSLLLGFGEEKYINFPRAGTVKIVDSLLEPPSHAEIYKMLGERLIQPAYKDLAEVMNFIIIRDTGEKAVIFNVAELSGTIVRRLKALAELLENGFTTVKSAWIFHDPSRSDYYLEQKNIQPGTLRKKKLFGYDMLRLQVDELIFLVDPFAFSQVNVPMMQIMIKRAGALLGKADSLLDLYCGYGLFAHALSDSYKEITGIDSSAPGINAAKNLYEKRKKMQDNLSRMNFYEGWISPEILQRRLPPTSANEHIILDPPRQGTGDGIIDLLAARNPRKVLHIFCEINQIPRALNEWKKSGYFPVQCQPLDMFAGTTGIETLVVLQKKE